MNDEMYSASRAHGGILFPRMVSTSPSATTPTVDHASDGGFVITIDGLAASGKSTVARAVAARLGVPYVSSGLLYRAVTVAALGEHLDVNDEAALMELLGRRDVRLEARTEGNRAWLDAQDITDVAHSSAVDTHVSPVARHPRVRAWVNMSIKRLQPPFIAEGRDMGTVAFPDASLKLYLTASPRVRAQRRVSERSEDLEVIQTALEARDALDAVNSSPAPDAVLLDTSDLTLEGVVSSALEHIRVATR
jgi:CMP/dCMP kinase